MKQDRRTKKEIRSILLGRTVLTEDGILTAPEPGAFAIPQGVVNGAGAVRFFGVKGTERYYLTGLGEEELMAAAADAMRKIGRAVYLREQPEAAACLLRFLLTRPAVLTMCFHEAQPVLTVWTGRGLMGWVSRLRAFSAFERELSAYLRRDDAKKPDKKRRKKKNAPPEEAEDTGEAWEEAPEGTWEEAPGGTWEEAPGETWGDAPGEAWEEVPPEAWEDVPEEEWEEVPPTTAQEDTKE